MGVHPRPLPSTVTTHTHTDMSPMMEAVIMADHFDSIQKLPEGVSGVPNWRCVPGYQVYGCGQPTLAGFEAALAKLTSGNKSAPVVWINMRQEPSLYLNGSPVCARPANKIGEYAELGDVTADIVEKQEEEFLGIVKSRAADNKGKVQYMDVHKAELEVECKEILSLGEVMKQLQYTYTGLKHVRVPVCNSGPPNHTDFDRICAAITGSKFAAPVVINCQAGLTRATTGQVVACLFREMQVGSSFSGLVNTVPGLNLDLLKMDNYVMDMEKDHLFRGEFDVVKQLLNEFPDMKKAKDQADKLIDLCGPPKTGGTGIKQLRGNIAESKLSYEIMDDAAQAFLKVKIMDNIHKYYFLICFTAYMREAADLARNAVAEDQKAALTLTSGKCAILGDQLKLPRTFAAFMEENSGMRGLIDTGKGNLQWERDIPPAALANLEKLAQGDFRGNLGKIIHDIYQTAHTMFSDMPQGNHKKRAKYRFASKTLMRLLPQDLCGQVESMIEQKTITLDLYDILGQCTWGQK